MASRDLMRIPRKNSDSIFYTAPEKRKVVKTIKSITLLKQNEPSITIPIVTATVITSPNRKLFMLDQRNDGTFHLTWTIGFGDLENVDSITIGKEEK